MSEQIEVGQIWRRKKDGLLIKIKSYSKVWADCYWESVEGKKRGSIYAVNLPDLYERVIEND